MTVKFHPDERLQRSIECIRNAVAKHPPMPAMYHDLMVYVNSPDVDFKKLADIVRYDPGVTMNILKVVNSAAFSGATRIDSLQQAFVRLGARRLFQIILAQGVAAQLAQTFEGYDLAARMLLQHSVGVALTAESLAQHLGRQAPALLFTAGLLHDMGKIVLDPFVLKERPTLDTRLRDTDASFDEIEKDVLGVTHAEAGAWLMERWAFPAELVAAVGAHHHPENAGQYKDATLIVHLADTLIYSQGIGAGIDGFRYHVAEGAADALGLRSRDMEYIASSTLDRLDEWNRMI